MKTKSAYVILLYMILGLLLGCGTKEKEENSALETADEAADKAIDETADEAADKATDEEPSENSLEIVNAMGMPLKDDTVLLVTIKRQSGGIDRQFEYDKNGRILRYLNMKDYMYEYEYDFAGNLKREISYKFYYDDEGREIDRKIYSQTECAYDGTGRQLSRMMWEYDDDGSFERCFVYASSGQQSWKMEYLFDMQGNISYQYRYEYDDMGNKTLYVEYDAEGEVKLYEGECDTYAPFYAYYRYENTYDDFGNLTNVTPYSYENDEMAHTRYTYDDAGHLIKEEGVDGDHAVGEYTHEYTYDENGNLVSSFTLTVNEVYGKRYEYDGNGNCIKQLLDRYFNWNDDGNFKEVSPYIEQENQYDERNRLTQVYYAYSDTTYNYTYETIGVLDEDYPYDKIEIYGRIGELWYGGHIERKYLEPNNNRQAGAF